MYEYGTPEDFARMAARLRGQEVPSKAEANRARVESIHPPEAKAQPCPEVEEFTARLFAPKAGYAELIRALHGTEEPK